MRRAVSDETTPQASDGSPLSAGRPHRTEAGAHGLRRTEPDAHGLHRIEASLFVGGVFAFAFLMLVFGSPLPPAVYLPLVGGWIVAGLTFVWWFDRYLARAAHARSRAPTKLKKRR
jgi:hypothetical protein